MLLKIEKIKAKIGISSRMKRFSSFLRFILENRKFGIVILLTIAVIAAGYFFAQRGGVFNSSQEETVTGENLKDRKEIAERLKNLPRVELEAKEIFQEEKKDFPAGQNASFKIMLIQKKRVKKQSVFFDKALAIESAHAAGSQVIAATLTNPRGATLQDTDIFVDESGGEATITVEKPEQEFVPGKYNLSIEIIAEDGSQVLTSQQDFTWGVLAINLNKSIYSPGETAKLQFGVLDERGNMVCDAKLKLKIRNEKLKIEEELSTENGRIKVNEEVCRSHNFTLEPDYFAEYKTGGEGKYELTLTAETANGAHTIVDSFEVRKSVPFDVERTGTTRIYPLNDYPVTFTITANEDFEGAVQESIPASFEIKKVETREYEPFDSEETRDGAKILTWNVNLKKGEQVKLGYRYDAPDLSPEFYLLGPLKFLTNQNFLQKIANFNFADIQVVFQEARRWQIASDAPQLRGFSAYQLSAQAATPKIQTWNGSSSWNSPQNANSVTGTPRYVVVKANPQRDEIVVGTLDNANDVKVQLCTYAGSCGSVKTMTATTSSSTTRVFDIAIEQSSGDVIVAYEEGVNQQISYDRWNGSTWAGEAYLTIGTASTLNSRWVELVEAYDPTSPNPDNLMVCVETAVTSTYTDAYCAPWTGSSNSFGSVQTISTDLAGTTTVTSQGFNGAFEDTSGDFTVFYGYQADGQLRWSTYSGGSWSSGTGNDSGSTALFGWRTAVYPDTNRIMAAWYSGTGAVYAQEWTGAGMGGNGAGIDTSVETAVHPTRALDVQPVIGWSVFIVMYGDSNQDQFSYKICTSEANCSATTPTWTAERTPDTTVLGTDTRWGQLYAEPNGAGHMVWMGISQTLANGWYKGRMTCDTTNCSVNETANSVGAPTSISYQSADFDWIEFQPTITISGNIYQSGSETTQDNTAYQIFASVNNGVGVGITAPGNGTYSISVPLMNTQPIAVYIKGHSNDANTLTVGSEGTNVTNANLYVGKVAVSNGSAASATTNANICTQASYPESGDRLFSCSGNNLTLNSGVELHVIGGGKYSTGETATLTTQGSGGDVHVDDNAEMTFSSAISVTGNLSVDAGATLSSASSDADIAGVLTLASTGTLNAGSGIWTLSGSGTPFVENGTFNYDTSTFKFTSASDTNIAATEYYNLQTGTEVSFHCGDSVNFIYKGSSVTYGTVQVGSQCWMDRNLGASQVATSYNDSASYGDLFQWGRLDDGHQTPTSGTTTSLSSGDVPGHSNFIYGMGSPYDWRSPQNDSLWQASSYTNNPCPSGWHVPTQTEWATAQSVLGLTGCSSNCLEAEASSALKLPAAGYRYSSDASLYNQGSSGYYWSSSPYSAYAYYLYFNSTGVAPESAYIRAIGFSIRCLNN